jgi:hypothetical protein
MQRNNNHIIVIGIVIVLLMLTYNMAIASSGSSQKSTEIISANWVWFNASAGAIQAIAGITQAVAAIITFFLMWRLGKEQTRINTMKGKQDIYDDLIKAIEDCTSAGRMIFLFGGKSLETPIVIKVDSPIIKFRTEMFAKLTTIKKVQEKIYFLFNKKFSEEIEVLINTEVSVLTELNDLYFIAAMSSPNNSSEDAILETISEKEHIVTENLKRIKTNFREHFQS